VIALLMAAAVEAAPPAEPPSQTGREITRPRWYALPSAKDVAKVYPAAAAGRYPGGRAVIGCTVTVGGALENCRLVSEDPPGVGFGEAALAMSPLFRLYPKGSDGKSLAGGTVRVPIVFGAPDADIVLPPLPPGGLRFGQVLWLETPTRRRLGGVYPSQAARRNLAGRVVLHCKAGQTGQLVDCAVVEEDPVGQGFAAASLRVAGDFRMRMTAMDGRPIAPGTTIQAPLRFRMFPTQLEPVNATHPKLSDGQVFLDCRVTPEGRLDNCVVDSETPLDAGLGDIALRLSARMKFAERPGNELDRIRLPINFRKAEPAAAPVSAAGTPAK
jgi:hypothetical protein